MLARIGVLKALHRGVVRQFNPRSQGDALGQAETETGPVKTLAANEHETNPARFNLYPFRTLIVLATFRRGLRGDRVQGLLPRARRAFQRVRAVAVRGR
jgi:hypothetical protein